MAQYLTDFIETPMFVMNSAFDVCKSSMLAPTPVLDLIHPGILSRLLTIWNARILVTDQVQNILVVGCVPRSCNQSQIQAMEHYRSEFINESISHLAVRSGRVGHGAFICSCLVHEQNLDYCSGGNPHAYNCAGWLTTTVRGVTAQQAYSAWHRGDAAYNMTIDPATTLAPAPGDNPTCPWTFPPHNESV